MLLPQQWAVWQWLSKYYLAPMGEVYKVALPAGLKAEEGFRPKTELYVGLTKAFSNEKSLHLALDMLTRAQRQRQVL